MAIKLMSIGLNKCQCGKDNLYFLILLIGLRIMGNDFLSKPQSMKDRTQKITFKYCSQ